MKRRKRSIKLRKIRPTSKSRETRCYLGESGTSLFNPMSGMTWTGPIYTEWIKRLSEEWCKTCYNAARYSPHTTSVSPYQNVLGREEIVGFVGSRRGYNNVVHRKIGTVNLPSLCMHKSHKNSSYGYEDYYRYATTRGYALYLGQQVDELRCRYHPGHDKLFSARAFWSMRPKFEGEVSLLNSIFELKDFKDVLNVQQWSRNFRSISQSNLFSDYKREFKKLSRDQNIRATLHEKGLGNYADATPSALKTLARDSSGAAASTILTMNLAIKPTIADAMAIAAQFATSAANAQSVFQQYGELGTTSHFSENDSVNSTIRRLGSVYYTAEGSHWSVKQTATMRSFYDYTMRTKNQALVKYWGLTGSAETLWNMLPMSFVVDYIATIGKSLQYMMRDDNVTNLTTEYCESVKIVCNDGLFIIHDSSVPALLIDGRYYKPSTKGTPRLVSGTQATRYERKVMEPYKGPALPKLKLPSSTQAVNMLALARMFVN